MMAWGLLVLFGAGLFLLFKQQLTFKSTTTTLIIFAIGVWYSLQLDMFQERMHLVEYGILGIIIFSSNRKQGTIFAFLAAGCVGLAAGSVDEIVQWMLPYRIGDIRDVFFDLSGVLWGASLKWALS